jgi:integrase
VLREWINRGDNGSVFPSTLYSARNLSKSCIIRVFITACDKAKIRGLTIHKLRHTFGLAEGVPGTACGRLPIKDVARLTSGWRGFTFIQPERF